MLVNSGLNFCLINPPLKRSKNNFSTISVVPPLGVAYLAAVANDHCNLSVIDGLGESLHQDYKAVDDGNEVFGLSLQEVVDRIPADVDLIGLSVMFTSLWEFNKELIELIRSRFPSVRLVLGGEHVTGAHKDILKELGENVVCVLGEGEETLLELLDVKKNKCLDEIRGIAFFNENKIVVNERRPRIKNIDSIPEPLWEKFPVENYINNGHGGSIINRRSIPLLYSRGCPFRCMFCSAPDTWGTNYYLREPSQVINEIIENVEKYKLDSVEFLDLVGVFNKKWLREFEKLYLENNLKVNISFSPGTRSESLDLEVLTILKNINVYRVMYAPDSGSDEESKRIKKNVNFQKLFVSMKNCTIVGLPSRANILIGFPGQKKKDLWNTFKVALKCAWLGVNDVLIITFYPYSGSEFYKELKQSSDFVNLDTVHLEKYAAASLTSRHSYTEHISGEVLAIFRLVTMSLCFTICFLKYPSRVLSMFRNISARQPVSILENALFLKFFRKF